VVARWVERSHDTIVLWTWRETLMLCMSTSTADLKVGKPCNFWIESSRRTAA
jgi:hypothetical protein